jgi:shikimate dehydrogenase
MARNRRWAALMGRRLFFVGVSTRGSSIMRIFPRWRDALRLGDVELTGRDLAPGAPDAAYRSVALELHDDAKAAGALVTTHKIGLYRAARDLFAAIDHYGELCGEVSCIAKREGLLHGWAKDPISSGRALAELLEPGHFERSRAHVLCMGAGGAGTAIMVHLLSRGPDRPRSVTITERDVARLEHVRRIVRRAGVDMAVEYVQDADHDRLLTALPPHSLVINATGMGKDLPGSPISDGALFPESGVVWELNYRGDLGFLRQARAQQRDRGLVVSDGWRYFIFGWTAVIEEVFRRPISDADLNLLADEAEFARPRTED